MKKTTVVCFLIFLSFVTFAQKDQNRIEASIVGFFNGLSLINADTLRYYSTPDFLLLEDGLVWNVDTLINKIAPRKNAGIKRINKFRFIKTVQSDKVAWVSYFNTAELTVGGRQQIVKWLESAVLVKRSRRWQIQLLHSTKLK